MRRSTDETPDSSTAHLRHRRWCHAANGAVDRRRYPPWIQPVAARRESTRPWRRAGSADRQLCARRHSRSRVCHRRPPGLAVRTRRDLGPSPACGRGHRARRSGYRARPTPPSGIRPGEPSVVTPGSDVHQIAGLLLFGGLSGAAFVLARGYVRPVGAGRSTPGSRAYSSSSSRSPLASPTGSTLKESGNRPRPVYLNTCPCSPGSAGS